MILSGRIYNSEQALALGVCDQIGQDPLELSLTFAEEISKNAPLALRMAKKSIDCGGVNTFKWEQDCYQVVLDSEDRLEGLRAFQEKRSPNYIGK